MAKQELKYSEQALVILANMPNFDKEDFEKWFYERLSVGSNNILIYLMEKEAQKLKEEENVK